MRRLRIVLGAFGVTAAALGFARTPLGTKAADRSNPHSLPRAAAEDTVTQVAMRNVNFYLMPNGALRIRKLRGTMRSLRGGPVVFDDKNSFVMHLTYAEIGLNGTDITTLMNKYIFAYPGTAQTAPGAHVGVAGRSDGCDAQDPRHSLQDHG